GNCARFVWRDDGRGWRFKTCLGKIRLAQKLSACVLSPVRLEIFRSNRMQKSLLRLLCGLPFLLSLAGFSFAQDSSKANERPQLPASQRREEKQPVGDPSRYSWEFKQSTFLVGHILIEHDSLGRGKITFEHRGDDISIVEPI